jgi:hypothetical protein
MTLFLFVNSDYRPLRDVALQHKAARIITSRQYAAQQLFIVALVVSSTPQRVD